MEHRFVSIAEAVTQLRDQPVATSRNRLWSSVTIDCHRAAKRDHLERPALDHHVVFYCSGGTKKLLQKRAGKSFQSTISPGSCIVMPAGLPCVWEGQTPFTTLIRVSTGLLRSAAEQIEGSNSKAGELLNVFLTRDHTVRTFANLFTAELVMPEHPAQALLIDSASCAFAAHLLRAYDAFGVRRVEHRYGLSSRSLALVTTYMQDHLEKTIRLDDLASLAQVSRFHFGRLFKLSMGVSPMVYLESVRIERAKTLLQSKALSIYDVAFACGFADQSYFAKRFAVHVNCTPSEYRKRYCCVVLIHSGT